MNKKKSITIIAIVLTLCLSVAALSGCAIFGRGDITEFADDLFPTLFSNDAISANIFFNDADNYLGLTPTASISTPSSKTSYETNYQAMYTQAALMSSMFRYSKMSSAEKDLFVFLQDFFIMQSKFANYYYFQENYIGGYSGMQSNLPIYLIKYSFRDEQDIKDYINICNLTATAFPQWVIFEQLRLDNGYGRNVAIIEAALSQCESFTGVDIDGGDTYPDPYAEEYRNDDFFILTDAVEKINAAEFLTAAQKDNYITSVTSAVQQKLVPAYIQLGISIDGLIKNNATKFKTGLMFNYVGGQSYYQVLFNDSTGTNDSVSAAYDKTLAAYDGLITEIDGLRTALATAGLDTQEKIDDAICALYNGEYPTGWQVDGLTDTITGLYESLGTNFPEINGLLDKLSFYLVDESIADSSAPASYFVSNLDVRAADEIITINNLTPTGYISYDLLSHEGIPGHLYQYNYLKNSSAHNIVKVLCPTSYKEGWATYAENYMLDGYRSGTTDNLLLKYMVKCNLAKGYLIVLSDIKLNYYGAEMHLEHGFDTFVNWVQARIGTNDYLLKYYTENEETALIDTYEHTYETYANSLFSRAIIQPCIGATYYYSYLQVTDIISAFKARGMSDYDAHKTFLDNPYPFKQIREKYGI